MPTTLSTADERAFGSRGNIQSFLAVLQTRFDVAKATFDVAVDGGAISTITPKLNSKIPDNAIILGGIIDNLTAFVGTNATIAVGTSAGSAADSLKAATAITSYTGLLAIVPVFTAATMIKMTAEGVITVTVATTALTAGKFDIYLLYLKGD